MDVYVEEVVESENVRLLVKKLHNILNAKC